jgi:uncharacterized 2Fe-2S/4Fe-4S cluster protein (DUF4445 family)
VLDKKDSKYIVIFQPSGRRGHISKGKTIKQASVELGVDIEGICGEKGTCGKCQVRIVQGRFDKYGIDSSRSNVSPLVETERKFITAREINSGYRLACQANILGDIVVFVPEQSRLGKQVIRKKAREIDIELKPAVRKYSVKLQKATLEDTLGDFERLSHELNKKNKLSNLSIDYQALVNLQKSVRDGDWNVAVSVWQDREIIKVEPMSGGKCYGLAVDIGTTTVAGYLCDLTDGSLVATASIMNPQVIYGEDVMSRISYTVTNSDGLTQMNRVIIEGLNGIVLDVTNQVGIEQQDILDMTIVGNTCMHHLFLNIDPRYIGKAPFPPALHQSIDIKARDLGINIAQGAYVHALPIEAGFVGADNVGVLIAEEPYKQDSVELIIDIGTNGELILGNREKLVSASCATGPAFEGAEIKFGMRAAPGAIEKLEIDRNSKDVRFKVIGKEGWNTEIEDIGAKGICGSGIIDIAPQLFLAGIIDKTGRFQKDLDTPRLHNKGGIPEFVIAWAGETSIGQDIVICQDDIRAIQLAKGAMYAGAKMLMRTLGVDKIDKVVLAGAFGSYIDKKSASLLGLFPDCDLENIYSVGNAAGEGARIALLNLDKRKEANEIAGKVDYIELTLSADFNKIFAQAMWIPHKKDEFPHLKQILS